MDCGGIVGEVDDEGEIAIEELFPCEAYAQVDNLL